jgi:hypothetical protein
MEGLSMEWRLVRGDVLLAKLRPDGQQLFADYPGGEAVYETTAAFEPLRSRFEREIKLLEADPGGENSEWNTEWANIWYELERFSTW